MSESSLISSSAASETWERVRGVIGDRASCRLTYGASGGELVELVDMLVDGTVEDVGIV